MNECKEVNQLITNLINDEKYFCQQMNSHEFNDIRQTKMYTTKYISFETEIAI